MTSPSMGVQTPPSLRMSSYCYPYPDEFSGCFTVTTARDSTGRVQLALAPPAFEDEMPTLLKHTRDAFLLGARDSARQFQAICAQPMRAVESGTTPTDLDLDKGREIYELDMRRVKQGVPWTGSAIYRPNPSSGVLEVVGRVSLDPGYAPYDDPNTEDETVYRAEKLSELNEQVCAESQIKILISSAITDPTERENLFKTALKAQLVAITNFDHIPQIQSSPDEEIPVHVQRMMLCIPRPDEENLSYRSLPPLAKQDICMRQRVLEEEFPSLQFMGQLLPQSQDPRNDDEIPKDVYAIPLDGTFAAELSQLQISIDPHSIDKEDPML